MILRLNILIPALMLGLLSTGCNSPSAPTTPEASETTPPEVSTSAEPEIVETPFELEEGFRLLSWTDFEPVLAEETTWKKVGDYIVTTGNPKSYLQTKETFDNYTLILEYRFLPKPDLAEEKRPLSNTGVLLYLDDEQKIWPKSIEVQGKFIEIASIKSNGGIPDVVIEDDAAAREEASHPVGQWNEMKILSADGQLTSFLNGKQICKSEPGELTSGRIGFQAEGFPVAFRRIRILPTTDSTETQE